MIRLLLVLIAIILFFILTLPVLLVLYIIGRKDPDRKHRAASAIVRWIFRVLRVLAGVDLTVKGQDKIPTDSGVLYVGNHRSFFDVVLTFPYTKGVAGYIAKNSLKKVPFLYTWMLFINCILFDRSDIKDGMRMIKAGTAILSRGDSVFVFPEGTRSKNPSELPLLEFHEGSFRMATKSKCPIVPVAITGTADILENHFPWIRKSNVTIEFCDPIYPEQVPKEMRKKFGLMAMQVIEEKLKENMA